MSDLPINTSKQVCIITGGNCGIGYDVAKKMMIMNYNVIIACRDPIKGKAAVAKLTKKYPASEVCYLLLDLTSKVSIENFANFFIRNEKKVNVLINNAAVFPGIRNKSPTFTDDGFELTFGTNHLGHFYLTLLLLETLKKNTPSRIVMVSSGLHDPETNPRQNLKPHLDFDNLQLLLPGSYNTWLAYSNSKLANVLFTNELARRLLGSGVTANSLNPGWIPTTNLGRSDPCMKCFLTCCCRGLCRCTGKTRSLSQGSMCIVKVATSQRFEDVSGSYFEDCEMIECSVEARDEDVARKLWDVSCTLLGLEKGLYDKLN